MRKNLALTRLILQRLEAGPVRPCDILHQLELPVERFDKICAALRLLESRGRVRKTRTVIGGRWGGNVSASYHLVEP